MTPAAAPRQSIESREGRAFSVEPELHKSSKISELADSLQRTLSVEQASVHLQRQEQSQLLQAAGVAGLKALKQGFVEKSKVSNDAKAKCVISLSLNYITAFTDAFGRSVTHI